MFNIFYFNSKVSSTLRNSKWAHEILIWFYLKFNGPVNTVKVMANRSVNQLTFSWAGLVPGFSPGFSPLGTCPILCAHTFASIGQPPFLIQRKGEKTVEIISWSLSTKVVWPNWGSVLRLPTIWGTISTNTMKGSEYTYNRGNYVKIIWLPSEKGSTLKGKNLLPVGANSFLL